MKIKYALPAVRSSNGTLTGGIATGASLGRCDLSAGVGAMKICILVMLISAIVGLSRPRREAPDNNPAPSGDPAVV